LEHIAPHDLRRTCAKLCHSNGGEIEQIQFLLGHASIQTTERHLGCKQNLGHPVNDLFDLRMNVPQAETSSGSATVERSTVEMASLRGVESHAGGSEYERSIPICGQGQLGQGGVTSFSPEILNE
jgi:hypothetical protein